MSLAFFRLVCVLWISPARSRDGTGPKTLPIAIRPENMRDFGLPIALVIQEVILAWLTARVSFQYSLAFDRSKTSGGSIWIFELFFV